MKPWRAVPVVLLCAVALWAMVAGQPAQPPALASLAPEGALLYLEAKDFHSLLSDWNNSPEKRSWLQSDNDAVFSRSRLFSRLSDAQGEFAAAAGTPPDANLLNAVAGGQSCIALYDIGKLEFIYITRMDEAAAQNTALWQTRGNFEARSEAGVAFYVRQDPDSKRVAAFAVDGGWLILGTREDLVADVLDRLQGAGGRSVQDEAWYGDAVHQAQGSAGDLRMVLNLDKIVPSPYFRSYWIQRNVTEMKQYASAVSDLYRNGNTWREERVLLRRASGVALPSDDVSALAALAPQDAPFWSAQASPDPGAVLNTLREDLLEMRAEPMPANGNAPGEPVAVNAGNAGDLEVRIDQAPAVEAQADPYAPLQDLLRAAPPSGLLQVDASGPWSGGAFLALGRAMVVSGPGNWDKTAVQAALSAAILPGLTTSGIGAQWETRQSPSGEYLALHGQLALFAAIRGNDLFLSSDATLLEKLLANQQKSPTPGSPSDSGVTYAAVFRHTPQEQTNFIRLTSALDRAGNRGSQDNGTPAAPGENPAFFSGDMASFSRVFARVSQERVEERDRGSAVSQTVVYEWTQ